MNITVGIILINFVVTISPIISHTVYGIENNLLWLTFQWKGALAKAAHCILGSL